MNAMKLDHKWKTLSHISVRNSRLCNCILNTVGTSAGQNLEKKYFKYYFNKLWSEGTTFPSVSRYFPEFLGLHRILLRLFSGCCSMCTMQVLGLSCVFALWLSSHVSVHAHQPIMLRNTDPFSDTDIEDGLSERWFPFYNHSGIVLGTLWCGKGNISSGPNMLGTLKSTDACCRTHDMCPDIIEARGTKHGLNNTADYTRLSCDCDEKFRQCLKKSEDEISGQLVGMGYFTVLGTKCFRVDYPIVRCIKRSWFFAHCEKYELDTKGQKKYQWFDVHTF